jgi:hypothetical protein
MYAFVFFKKIQDGNQTRQKSLKRTSSSTIDQDPEVFPPGPISSTVALIADAIRRDLISPLLLGPLSRGCCSAHAMWHVNIPELGSHSQSWAAVATIGSAASWAMFGCGAKMF